MAVSVSRVTSADAPVLLEMIKELAEFEKAPDSVKINEAQLADDLNKSSVSGFLLREGKEPVGMLLFYFAYSTWEGQFIHMEDLFVRAPFRRKGYGKVLWRELGLLAKKMNIKRMEWNVLDWNSRAIAFYKNVPYMDMTKDGGWMIYRLDANGIDKVAELGLKIA